MSCNSRTLAGFDGACERSLGGIKVIYLATYAENTFTISAEEDGATGNVTAVATPTAFKKYTFRKGTGSLTSALNVDDANGVNYIGTDVVLQMTKMQSASRLEINALALGGAMGIVIDANGTAFAIGTEQEVNAGAGTGQTGTAVGDGNYYQITLHDDRSDFPPILTSEALATFIAAQAGGNNSGTQGSQGTQG